MISSSIVKARVILLVLLLLLSLIILGKLISALLLSFSSLTLFAIKFITHIIFTNHYDDYFRKEQKEVVGCCLGWSGPACDKRKSFLQ